MFKAFYLQLSRSVETLDALMIVLFARFTQLQINHARAVATMPMCQGNDAFTLSLVMVKSRLIAQCTRFCLKSRRAKVRQGKNRRKDGVYML